MDVRIADGVHITAHKLDEISPGWEWYVDPSSLNMKDPGNCIIGQLGLNSIWYNTENEYYVIGFCLDFWSRKRHNDVKKEWLYQINQRITKRSGWSAFFWWLQRKRSL